MNSTKSIKCTPICKIYCIISPKEERKSFQLFGVKPQPFLLSSLKTPLCLTLIPGQIVQLCTLCNILHPILSYTLINVKPFLCPCLPRSQTVCRVRVAWGRASHARTLINVNPFVWATNSLLCTCSARA